MQEKGELMRIFRVLLLVLVFLPFEVNAQSVPNALTSANQGNWSPLVQLRQSSPDPAARKLLSWYAYTHGAPNVVFDEIANFIAQNPNWPGLSRLRREAEERMGANVADAKILAFVKDTPPAAANAMDRYAQILLAQGQQTKLRQVLNDWWPTANLTRDEQKEIYARYTQYLTRASHAKRLNALIHQSQYSNATAIADVLGGGYPTLLNACKAIKQDAPNMNALIAAVPSALQSDDALLYERLKWRRENNLNDGAIEILNRAPKAADMYAPADWWKERHIIVRRLIEEKQYKRAYALVSNHRQTKDFPQAQAEWVSGWLALRFAGEPWKAFEHFETLYKVTDTPLSKSRGAYWAGRASEALNNPDIARQWYQVAAAYKETYYGQLAGKKIGALPNLSSRVSPNVPASEQAIFNNNELVKAAQWLHAANMPSDRDVFLFKIGKNSTGQAQAVQAIQLANRFKRPNIAIKIAQDIQKDKGYNFYEYLYPMLVSELKGVNDVEWAFINAIIRQESRFDQGAQSHAGARGLMQLMPTTAQETARKSGIAHQTAWLTTRPDHNIYLGSRYLGQMVARYDGNYAMAAAAYNAGPGRVDGWIKEFGDPRQGNIDFLDWVERIPIYETRNYVQRVLEAVYVYREQLKGQQKVYNAPIHVELAR